MNVYNVHVYRPDIPCIQQSVQFTLLVLEHALLQYYLLRGEISICALCYCYRQSLQCSFIVLLGTHHCWVDRDSMEWKVFPTLLHMNSSGNQTPDVESNVWSTKPHATIYILSAVNFGTIFYLLVYALISKLDKIPLMWNTLY